MKELPEELLSKYNALKDYLKSLGKVAIAFSSGVDSAFLLYAACDAYKDSLQNVIALTATSSFFPKREFTEADEFCRKLGVTQIICKVSIDDVEGFKDNPKNRCYICKKNLFVKFVEDASSRGVSAVCEGSNVDDEGDYRPGLIAIKELGILSPLRRVGLKKEEIRLLSNYFNLPTWNKPSFACLASRFPYGESITAEKLSMVERGEDFLLSLGFTQFRVRIHGDSNYKASIELLKEEMPRLEDVCLMNSIEDRLKSFGFFEVFIDPKGYRTGSMNEVLSVEERKISGI